MPHYFFDTADGDQDRDEVGVDLPHREAARVEAIRYLAGLLTDRPDHLLGGKPLIVLVRDEQGKVVVEVEARDKSTG